MTFQERPLVLCHEGTGARAQHGDFGLDILDVIVVRFEVDLSPMMLVSSHSASHLLGDEGLTCLIATVSPVALSIPL
jgi:hypothetical protein